MSTKELLINEINYVPEPFLIEVLDYVHFLKGKIVREKLEITIMSESSLLKDCHYEFCTPASFGRSLAVPPLPSASTCVNG
jgi:hypothetical protein